MDVFAITKLGADAAQKLTDKLTNTQKSTFVNAEMPGMPPMPEAPTKKSLKLSDILTFVLGVIIGLYAAYLSWQCNSKLDYNLFLKVIFSVFAYLFGLVYLILYLVMRWDVCKKI